MIQDGKAVLQNPANKADLSFITGRPKILDSTASLGGKLGVYPATKIQSKLLPPLITSSHWVSKREFLAFGLGFPNATQKKRLP